MINLLKQTLKERDHHFELEERVIPWLDVDNDWSDLHPATASHLGRELSASSLIVKGMRDRKGKSAFFGWKGPASRGEGTYMSSGLLGKVILVM